MQASEKPAHIRTSERNSLPGRRQDQTGTAFNRVLSMTSSVRSKNAFESSSAISPLAGRGSSSERALGGRHSTGAAHLETIFLRIGVRSIAFPRRDEMSRGPEAMTRALDHAGGWTEPELPSLLGRSRLARDGVTPWASRAEPEELHLASTGRTRLITTAIDVVRVPTTGGA